MSKKDEYTAYALALLDLADHAPGAVQKQRLLRVAEGWLDLVERLLKHRYRSTNHKDEHPLVKERLGDGHTGA